MYVTRCPACGGDKCLPVSIVRDKNTKKLHDEIGECMKCGIKMSEKDYLRRLRWESNSITSNKIRW